jgi:HEAT repeat protein
LGEIQDARAVEPLIAVLKDIDSNVRSNAAEALGNIKDARAVEPLIAAMQDEASGVRKAAARALGEIQDARAATALITALKNKDLEVISQVYDFFICRGESGSVAILIETLDIYGDSQMAEYFLNSGNWQLKAAATYWAKKKGFEILPDNIGFGGRSWGSKK